MANQLKQPAQELSAASWHTLAVQPFWTPGRCPAPAHQPVMPRRCRNTRSKTWEKGPWPRSWHSPASSTCTWGGRQAMCVPGQLAGVSCIFKKFAACRGEAVAAARCCRGRPQLLCRCPASPTLRNTTGEQGTHQAQVSPLNVQLAPAAQGMQPSRERWNGGPVSLPSPLAALPVAPSPLPFRPARPQQTLQHAAAHAQLRCVCHRSKANWLLTLHPHTHSHAAQLPTVASATGERQTCRPGAPRPASARTGCGWPRGTPCRLSPAAEQWGRACAQQIKPGGGY